MVWLTGQGVANQDFLSFVRNRKEWYNTNLPKTIKRL